MVNAYLDCHDLETTSISLASAIGIDPAQLEQTLRHYDESRLRDSAEDPGRRMPRDVLERLGTTLGKVRFEGAFYFHGTRVLEPKQFRTQGILPLHRMVEQIWPTLYELVKAERTPTQWSEFRALLEHGDCRPYGRNCEHFCQFYRDKSRSDGLHLGPHGLLVRETLLDPQAASSHDYLGCPEIIQDIAICYAHVFGRDLEQRFHAASKPCIVKFRSPEVSPGAIMAALWYLYLKVREDRFSDASNWSLNYEGRAVPPADVVDVEVIIRQ